MEELLESYLNGNINIVKKSLSNAPFSLGELFEYYVNTRSPRNEEMILFVKRLTTI